MMWFSNHKLKLLEIHITNVCTPLNAVVKNTQRLQPTFIDDVCNSLLPQSSIEGNHHSGVSVAREGSYGPVHAVQGVDPKAALLSKR